MPIPGMEATSRFNVLYDTSAVSDIIVVNVFILQEEIRGICRSRGDVQRPLLKEIVLLMVSWSALEL